MCFAHRTFIDTQNIYTVFTKHWFHPNISTIILFRPACFIWMFMFMFSINMYGWDAYGVNMCLIFELDPRDRLNFWHMFCISGVLCLLWSSCLFGYVFSGIIWSDNVPSFPVPIYLWPIDAVFVGGHMFCTKERPEKEEKFGDKIRICSIPYKKSNYIFRNRRKFRSSFF